MLFTFVLSLFVSAVQQDSWRLCLDKKQLLKTSNEDEQKNIVSISSSELKMSELLDINYTQAAFEKGWERTLSVYDENDQELKTTKGNKLSLKTSVVKSLLEQHKAIKFYTLYSPTDPKMKAAVRLRRVHLCTVVLQ